MLRSAPAVSLVLLLLVPLAAARDEEKGYEVVVKEHSSGHTVPKKEVEEVFEWIGKTTRESLRKRR